MTSGTLTTSRMKWIEEDDLKNPAIQAQFPPEQWAELVKVSWNEAHGAYFDDRGHLFVMVKNPFEAETDRLIGPLSPEEKAARKAADEEHLFRNSEGDMTWRTDELRYSKVAYLEMIKGRVGEKRFEAFMATKARHEAGEFTPRELALQKAMAENPVAHIQTSIPLGFLLQFMDAPVANGICHLAKQFALKRDALERAVKDLNLTVPTDAKERALTQEGLTVQTIREALTLNGVSPENQIQFLTLTGLI